MDTVLFQEEHEVLGVSELWPIIHDNFVQTTIPGSIQFQFKFIRHRPGTTIRKNRNTSVTPCKGEQVNSSCSHLIMAHAQMSSGQQHLWVSAVVVDDGDVELLSMPGSAVWPNQVEAQTLPGPWWFRNGNGRNRVRWVTLPIALHQRFDWGVWSRPPVAVTQFPLHLDHAWVSCMSHHQNLLLQSGGQNDAAIM